MEALSASSLIANSRQTLHVYLFLLLLIKARVDIFRYKLPMLWILFQENFQIIADACLQTALQNVSSKLSLTVPET